MESPEPFGVPFAGGKVGGKSCINRSRVAGDSGGTINRGGGVVTGQGTGLCAQPPSEISTAAISSIELRVKFTLNPLAPSHVCFICGLSLTQGLRSGLLGLDHVLGPVRPNRR